METNYLLQIIIRLKKKKNRNPRRLNLECSIIKKTICDLMGAKALGKNKGYFDLTGSGKRVPPTPPLSYFSISAKRVEGPTERCLQTEKVEMSTCILFDPTMAQL